MFNTYKKLFLMGLKSEFAGVEEASLPEVEKKSVLQMIEEFKANGINSGELIKIETQMKKEEDSIKIEAKNALKNVLIQFYADKYAKVSGEFEAQNGAMSGIDFDPTNDLYNPSTLIDESIIDMGDMDRLNRIGISREELVKALNERISLVNTETGEIIGNTAKEAAEAQAEKTAEDATAAAKVEEEAAEKRQAIWDAQVAAVKEAKAEKAAAEAQAAAEKAAAEKAAAEKAAAEKAAAEAKRATPLGKAQDYYEKKGIGEQMIKIIQMDLSKLGYDIGEKGVDGKFGTATFEAVKKFQEDQKLLYIDGIVGEDTEKALKILVTKKAKSETEAKPKPEVKEKELKKEEKAKSESETEAKPKSEIVKDKFLEIIESVENGSNSFKKISEFDVDGEKIEVSVLKDGNDLVLEADTSMGDGITDYQTRVTLTKTGDQYTQADIDTATAAVKTLYVEAKKDTKKDNTETPGFSWKNPFKGLFGGKKEEEKEDKQSEPQIDTDLPKEKVPEKKPDTELVFNEDTDYKIGKIENGNFASASLGKIILAGNEVGVTLINNEEKGTINVKIDTTWDDNVKDAEVTRVIGKYKETIDKEVLKDTVTELSTLYKTLVSARDKSSFNKIK